MLKSSSSPPPSYSPRRPPPPYSAENLANEAKESTTVENLPPTPSTMGTKGTTNQLPGAVANTPVVVVEHPIEAPSFSSYLGYCPHCKSEVRTVPRYRTGALTWFCAVVVLICFFPLVFVPFYMESCKDSYHECPRCHMVMAVRKRVTSAIDSCRTKKKPSTAATKRPQTV